MLNFNTLGMHGASTKQKLVGFSINKIIIRLCLGKVTLCMFDLKRLALKGGGNKTLQKCRQTLFLQPRGLQKNAPDARISALAPPSRKHLGKIYEHLRKDPQRSCTCFFFPFPFSFFTWKFSKRNWGFVILLSDNKISFSLNSILIKIKLII